MLGDSVSVWLFALNSLCEFRIKAFSSIFISDAAAVVDTTTHPTTEEDLPTTKKTAELDMKDPNRTDYERLGRVYVAQYYMLFDDRAKRLSLVALYQHEDSFMLYNGDRFTGTRQILEKFEALTESVVERSIIAVDSQPLQEGGGLLMNVAGKYRFRNDTQARLYTQTFIFRPQKGSFFLQHDIFREIESVWITNKRKAWRQKVSGSDSSFTKWIESFLFESEMDLSQFN